MRKLVALVICLGLALLPAAAPAADAPAAIARVDRSQLAPGESLALSVTLQNGEGEVDVAAIKDFKVLSQGTSTSLQIVNGVTSREVIYNYLLIPQRQGQLTIPALSVIVAGQVLQTDPIVVTVSDRPAADPADAPEVWAEAVVSQPAPFVGQQITYTVSLYQSVQIANASLQAPAFDGFSAKEVAQRGSRRELINGREHVITQIHYILVPLAADDQAIEPAALQLGIVRPVKGRRRSAFDDFFNDPMFNRNRVEPRVIQTAVVPVRVKPLPPLPAGAPACSGVVGHFDLTAAVEKRELQVGDSTTLTITLQGRGNLMDAQAPAVQLPEGLKHYADAPQEEIQLDAQGYNGRKVFRTALVPVRDGRLTLPPVEWTYFDTQRGDYRTLRAALTDLQVAPAEGQAAAPAVTGEAPGDGKRRVELIGRDILPLKEDLSALDSRRPLDWLAFMLWMAAPALAYSALLAALRLRRVDASPAARMRLKARQALKAAAASVDQDQDEPFLTALYQALTAAIFSRAGRSGEALTWREAETVLVDAGEEPQLARETAELLSAVESAKFSGRKLSVDQRREQLVAARRMIGRWAA
jgi:hypothetical protein